MTEEKISFAEANELNDKMVEEIIKKHHDSGATTEEIKEELWSVWGEIAKNIDYNKT